MNVSVLKLSLNIWQCPQPGNCQFCRLHSWLTSCPLDPFSYFHWVPVSVKQWNRHHGTHLITEDFFAFNFDHRPKCSIGLVKKVRICFCMNIYETLIAIALYNDLGWPWIIGYSFSLKITVHHGGLMLRWDLLTLFWELLRHSSVTLTPRKWTWVLEHTVMTMENHSSCLLWKWY